MITNAIPSTLNNHGQLLTALPRNTSQVRNICQTSRNRSRLTRDALYNLHEFAVDSNFVHHITTYPDLEVFLYHPDILKHFVTTLTTDDHTTKPTQQMSYDTTFNLGDYYLSILIFRDTSFESSPIVPLAYLIHEHKLTSTHEAFFKFIANICPELNRASNLIIITDHEKSITVAIERSLPNL